MRPGEYLKTGLDNFLDHDTKEKFIALFVLPLASIFVLSGTGSTHWSTSESTTLGLDKYCTSNGTLTCCSSFPEAFGSNPGTGFNDKKMILMRVILGDMYLTSTAHDFKRPPCKMCIASTGRLDPCDKETSHNDRDDWIFDSVLYDNPKKHREFVVYDRNICYPEYIITYNRL